MKIFDKKFSKYKLNYVLQSICAGVTVALALILFDVVDQPMIVASFGASAFIVFVRPESPTSNPRNLIGGYIVGITAGILFHFITYLSIEHDMLERVAYVLAGGGAVMLAVFCMAVTNTEHAPAASIALGFVINNWKITTISNVLIGIILISAVHAVLKKKMVNLF